MTSDNLLGEMARAVSQKKQIVYIGSHPLLIERRRRELLQQTGGYANVRWYTWSQWVDRQLHTQGRSYVRITQATRQDIVESLLHQLRNIGRIPCLADGLQHPGMGKSVALWIEDVAKEIEGERYQVLSASKDPVLRELCEVATAYFNWTSDPAVPYKEAYQLESLVSELLRNDGYEWFEEQRAVFFLEGEDAPTTSRANLIASLRTRKQDLFTNFDSYSDVLELPALPIRWFTSTYAAEEVRTAVHDVERALQHGTPLSEVALVVPNEEYRRLAARELRRNAIPVRNAGRESLIHRGPVQDLLSLYQLKASNWSKEALLSAVDRQGDKLGVSDRALAFGRDLIRQSGVPEGAEEWRDLFLASWGRGRKRLAHLLDQGAPESSDEVRSVRKRVEAAGEWLRLVRRFSRQLNAVPEKGLWSEFLQITRTWLHPHSPEDAPVCETMRHMLRVREDIERSISPEGGHEITVHRFLRWLVERARFTVLDSANEEQGVLICLPEEICGGRFTFLYVLGLAEGLYPSEYAPHWIWERGGQAERRLHEEMELRRLQAVLTSAAGALFLYTPRMIGRRQPAVPNRDLQRLLGEPEYRSVDLRRASGPSIQAPAISEADTPLYTEGDTLHVTGLDLYRRCAFRYFADRVLHVRTANERNEGLTPLDIGSIMHSVLKKWVEAGEFLVEDTAAKVEQLLEEELDAYELRWRLSGAIWRSQRARVRQDLLRFVEQERAHLAMPGQMSIGEWGFGLVHEEKMAASSTTQPLLLQQAGRTLSLCGIVDRIDVGPDGFAIHDYKLSTCPTPQEIAEGEDLQVALYLLAYHRLTGAAPQRGRYALLREPGAGKGIEFAGEAAEDFASFIERVERRVFSLVDRMKKGDVSPHPWKRTECQRCTYQTVCRQTEWQERREEHG